MATLAMNPMSLDLDGSLRAIEPLEPSALALTRPREQARPCLMRGR